jgi:Uma2 family endonuclease
VSTIEEIQEAIRQLPGRDREFIADWLREFIVEEDYRVAEPTAAYGARVKRDLMSMEEYLEFEEGTPIRHEYVAGEIFAMSGGSLEHELIGGNVFAAFHAHLRGGPCKLFMNNFKLHLEVNEVTIHRRSEHWAPQLLTSPDETAEFRSIELSLPLGQIYEGALAHPIS